MVSINFTKIFVFIMVLAAASTISARALADGPERQLAPYFRMASAPELSAAVRYARDILDRAKRAGRPVDVIVAVSGANTLISLESVAVCDRIRGCPLLVFRDINKPPVLTTMAFENITMDFRPERTSLVLHDNSGPARDCTVSVPMKARCRAESANSNPRRPPPQSP